MRLHASPQEEYTGSLWTESHPLFQMARTRSDALELSRISISANEGRILSLVVKMNACSKFVEVGTLTGYSALWILKGLKPGGTLWTFELEEKHAKASADVLIAAEKDYEFSHAKSNLIEGDAREKLKTIESEGPFDGIFIDANKAAYEDYLTWAEKNLKKGGVIVADNIFLGGSVFSSDVADEGSRFSAKQVEVMRRMNLRLAEASNYDSAVIPTTEGLFVAVKKF